MLGSWNSFHDSQVLAPWLEAHEQLLRKETDPLSSLQVVQRIPWFQLLWAVALHRASFPCCSCLQVLHAPVIAPISLIGSPSRTSLSSSLCSLHQLFICSEGTLFSVSPETLSPKKLHDLSKAPCQGARSEEITCPVYNPVSHTGDSHTAHSVSRNNLAAFQHRACPCCRAPCAIPNYDVASISTPFSPGETGDLATAVLCCPCPPAGVQGMLAKGKQQDSCLWFLYLSAARPRSTCSMLGKRHPSPNATSPTSAQSWDRHGINISASSSSPELPPVLSFPLSEENVSLKQELKQQVVFGTSQVPTQAKHRKSEEKTMRQKRKLFLIHSPAGMHDSEFVMGRPIKLRYGPAKQKSCSGQ